MEDGLQQTTPSGLDSDSVHTFCSNEHPRGLLIPRLPIHNTKAERPVSDITVHTQAVDRHIDFALTVDLAATSVKFAKFQLPELDPLWTTCTLNDLWKVPCASSPTASICQFSGKLSSRSTRNMTSRTGKAVSSSGHSAYCTGVAIRPYKLAREETIPVRSNGKRSLAASDRKIRIWVQLPEGKLGIWVDPDLPVGPSSPAEPKDLFERYWGVNAELNGPYTCRSEGTGGRITPVRALLSARSLCLHRNREAIATSTGVLSLSTSGENLTQMSPCTSAAMISTMVEHERQSNLKAMIEAATGLPIAQQLLVFGLTGKLDDNSKVLCDYGIGHGALLLLSKRRDHLPRSSRDCHKRRPRMVPPLEVQHPEKSILNPGGGAFRRARRFQRSVGKDVLEVVPNWKTHTDSGY
jgi:hypothetical protein